MLVSGLLLLGACSSNPLDSINLDTLNPFKEGENQEEQGSIGFVRGFFGGVAVDEPRAALVGRDILSSGGTAADVAVAVTLALAVTKPSSASLGGGGVCLVHDAISNTTETLDFLAGVPKTITPGAVRPSAIPGTLRGLALLHSRYGRLGWNQLVSPAEKLARFGNPVSRATATDLARLPPAVLDDPEFRRIFAQGKDGRLIGEGDFFKQQDLSAVLSRIRVRGAGEFYTGLLGRSFVGAVNTVGGGFTRDDLRSYAPKWRPTLRVPYIQNTNFHFPATLGPSGVLAAQMMAMMVERGEWENASPLQRSHLMAEISARAYSYRTQWLRDDGDKSTQESLLVSKGTVERLLAGIQKNRHTSSVGESQASAPPASGTGTSFVAVDREGSAVACGLTLNNLFGTGRIAPGTGILLSALPGPRGRGPDSLSAVLLINSLHNTFFFAGAASGGGGSPSALVQVTTGTLMAGKNEGLVQAIGTRRVHNGGDSGQTYFEEGLDGAVVEGLTAQGHQLSPVAGLGLVNALFCTTGIPNKEGLSCLQQSDPRGFGLSSGAQ
ncbi:MAG: gamma-glutamyltransferase [Rhodospirillales bacterium]|nr:gamma-glutamyltransferase [Rhodospirillales bacterium]